MPARRRSLSLLSCLAVVAASLLTVTVATPAPAHAAVDYSAVKINEVQANGNPDWVELTNTGSTTVDISGLDVLDDTSTHAFQVVPDGTTVAPGGFYALDVSTFGLGNTGDQVRVYPPGTAANPGPDVPTIDSYTWTTAAGTGRSWGRCPDGTGAFVATQADTKGVANSCPSPYAGLKINEIQANGTPDYVEVTNVSTATIDISGVKLLDNTDTHTYQAFPSGTTVAPGAFVTIDSTVNGLGNTGDSVRLYPPDAPSPPAATPTIDSYTWTAAAGTGKSFGRCPDGTGAIVVTQADTKGAANSCSAAQTVPDVKINEVESDGGDPGDWVELVNNTTAAVDVSGWIFKDNQDADSYPIPAGTSIAPHGYYVLNVADFAFGLGAADSARLYLADGVTPVDAYSWTAHATTTYGRCPDGTGDFTTTQQPTKGAKNLCPGDLATSPWPGGAAVSEVDTASTFGTNLSGLMYQGSGSAAPGTLWAVDNGPSKLYKLGDTGGTWGPDAGDWATGKSLHYTDGTGDPDAEGVTFTAAGPGAGVYVSTERDNSNSTVSRPAVLMFDPSTAGASLNAVHDYNLTADLPTLGANLGLEGVAWVPDSYLTSHGFVDDSTGAAYTPSSYPDHGTGLFLVGVEANGMVYGYEFDRSSNSYHRVTSFASGFPAVMDLHWDTERQQLWVVCDNTCNGRTGTFTVQSGHFAPTTYYERPTGMPNYNNEGFTPAASTECVDGLKPVFWSDDDQDNGHALREGTIDCTAATAQPVSITSVAPSSPVVGDTYAVTATWGDSANPVVLSVTTPSVCSITGSTVSFAHAGSCSVRADQAGDDDHTAGFDVQDVTVGKGASTTTATFGPGGLTVTVTGAATPAGQVTVSIAGQASQTVDLSGGAATVTVPDTHQVDATVTYSGDSDLTSSTTSASRTSPTLTVSADRAPNAAHWYDAPVTLTWTCATGTAPLTGPCPSPVVLRQGAAQSATASVAATDGGTAHVTAGPIDVDLTDPTVRVGGLTDGATYRGAVPSARCVGADALSGIARCVVGSAQSGRRVTVTAVATDRAGNAATAVLHYTVPAQQVLGAAYSGGSYRLVAGRTYRVQALVAASVRPRLIGPVGKGVRLAGAGRTMARLGAVGGGLVEWKGSVTIPRSARPGALWKYGVKVAGSTIAVPLKVVRR